MIGLNIDVTSNICSKTSSPTKVKASLSSDPLKASEITSYRPVSSFAIERDAKNSKSIASKTGDFLPTNPTFGDVMARSYFSIENSVMLKRFLGGWKLRDDSKAWTRHNPESIFPDFDYIERPKHVERIIKRLVAKGHLKGANGEYTVTEDGMAYLTEWRFL